MSPYVFVYTLELLVRQVKLRHITTTMLIITTIFIANAAINFKTLFTRHHMGSPELKINFKAAIYDL